MKAVCKKSFPALAGILDVGDSVEIEVIRSTKEDVLYTGTYFITDDKGYIKKITNHPEVRIVRPAGSYIGYHFKSKNGQVYSDHCIYCMIGNKTLSDLFDK